MKKKLAVSLFILGFIIFTYPHLAQRIHHYKQLSTAHQVRQELSHLPTESLAKRLSLTQACNEAIFQGKGHIQDPFTDKYRQTLYEDCHKLMADDLYMATLEIPTLKLEIPIYLGASEKELSKGIGQVDGSSLPLGGPNTHSVLAGHRGMGTKEMFRHLDRLQLDDRFIIHTISGALIYRVIDIQVILPSESASLQIVEGKDLSSLITCHPYRSNSQRLVVYGERELNQTILQEE